MSSSLMDIGPDEDGTGVHDVALPSSNHDDPSLMAMSVDHTGVYASGIASPNVGIGVGVDGEEDDDGAARGGPNTDSVSSNPVAASDVEGGSIDHSRMLPLIVVEPGGEESMILGRSGDAGTSCIEWSRPLREMRKSGILKLRMGTGVQGGWETLDSVEGGVQSTNRPFARGDHDGGDDGRASAALGPPEGASVFAASGSRSSSLRFSISFRSDSYF